MAALAKTKCPLRPELCLIRAPLSRSRGIEGPRVLEGPRALKPAPTHHGTFVEEHDGGPKGPGRARGGREAEGSSSLRAGQVEGV